MKFFLKTNTHNLGSIGAIVIKTSEGNIVQWETLPRNQSAAGKIKQIPGTYCRCYEDHVPAPLGAIRDAEKHSRKRQRSFVK